MVYLGLCFDDWFACCLDFGFGVGGSLISGCDVPGVFVFEIDC